MSFAPLKLWTATTSAVAPSSVEAPRGTTPSGAMCVEQAVKDHQHDTCKTGRKLHALARRMRDRIGDYLRFAADLRSPFDNNAAEQQIRMVKIRRRCPGACAPSTEPSNSR
jgi:hypothetical protein